MGCGLASLLEMTVETLCRALHLIEERGAIRLVTPDIVEVLNPRRPCLLGRGQDGRLQGRLLHKGWKWGACPLRTRPMVPALPNVAANQRRFAEE